MDKNGYIEELRDLYIEHLNECIMPFWLKNSIDNEFGGVFTCFDNTGKNRVSTDKYTWSQGRMVWVFSALSSLAIYSKEEKQKFLKLAKLCADFLVNNCVLPNGNCTFVMERDGKPKPQNPGDQLDTSFYADCFVVLGLSKLAAESKEQKYLNYALDLYDSIYKRVKLKTFKSEPYPAPKELEMHGVPMITLNVASELSDALKRSDNDRYQEINDNADELMNEILNKFLAEDYIVHEMVHTERGIFNHSLLGRYFNPGHTLEDMWFIIHQAKKSDNKDVIKKAVKVIEKAFETGWDNEFGGLLLFADMEGGKPKGDITGYENEKMVTKVLNDWDGKLWWPHSEALYSLLLAYDLTEDDKFLDMHKKVHEYVFNTFPNPDKEIGEWIQIRDRQGNPEQKVVALPVKDPFHIARNLILIIELTDK